MTEKFRSIVIFILILLVTILADWLMVHYGTASRIISFNKWAYHIPFWFGVWLICRLFYNFRDSVAAVISLSVFEDVGYWLLNSWLTDKPFYPIDDTWMIGNFGFLGQAYSYPLFGLPAGYFVFLGIVALILFWRKNDAGRNQNQSPLNPKN